MAAFAALGLTLAGCSDGGAEAEDGIEGGAVPEDYDTDPGIVEEGGGSEGDDSAVPEDYDTDPGIVEQGEDGEDDGGIGED